MYCRQWTRLDSDQRPAPYRDAALPLSYESCMSFRGVEPRSTGPQPIVLSFELEAQGKNSDSAVNHNGRTDHYNY